MKAKAIKRKRETQPESDLVYLECVAEGRRLRVKIISPNYNNTANCVFPRDLRKEGRKFTVPKSTISFGKGPRGTFFYRVNKKSLIKVLDEPIPDDIKIYSVGKCIICFDKDTETEMVVYIPCGHECMCIECDGSVKICPMCRIEIERSVKRSEIK